MDFKLRQDSRVRLLEKTNARYLSGEVIPEEVDLIVISSHGRTGLGRIIFGSTAEAVVRHARCPVLVVKPPPEEEEGEQ